MRSLIVIGLVLSVGTASADERLNELFATWEKATKDFKSLVVEAKETRTDGLKGRDDCRTVQAQLVRTTNGLLRGEYRVTSSDASIRPDTVLLVATTAYTVVADKKEYLAHKIEDEDTLGFLTSYFNPLVLLLNRERAEEKYHFEITKSDKVYTYIKITCKKTSTENKHWFKWHLGTFPEARLVVPNQASDSIPQSFPAQIWFRFPNGDQLRHDITRWTMNSAEKLEIESTPLPEKHEGWTVTSHPLPILRDRKGRSSWDYFPKDPDFYPKQEKK